MLDVLRGLENSQRRQRVDQVSTAYDGTFRWLFAPDVEFQDWLCAAQQNKLPIFWIQGKPGSGKSTLMKYALGHQRTRELLERAAPGPWTIVSYFFHERGSRIQKSTDGLLQELLYSLLHANGDLIQFVIPAWMRKFSHQKHVMRYPSYSADTMEQLVASIKSDRNIRNALFRSETWSIKSLQHALVAITRQTEVALNVLIFVDALDEHDGNHRDLIKFIRHAFTPTEVAAINVKMCFASRPESVYHSAFEEFPGLVIHQHTREDIQRYVREQINSATLGGK